MAAISQSNFNSYFTRCPDSGKGLLVTDAVSVKLATGGRYSNS